MKKAQNISLEKIILDEETVSFGGMLLNYQFAVCSNDSPRFYVRVAIGQEHMEAPLGDRIDPSLKLYHAIVRGRVTPCGLHDVVADYCV